MLIGEAEEVLVYDHALKPSSETRGIRRGATRFGVRRRLVEAALHWDASAAARRAPEETQ